MVTYDIMDVHVSTWDEDTLLATIRELAQEFGGMSSPRGLVRG